MEYLRNTNRRTCEFANLFSRLFIEVSLRVNVAQRHAEVRVDIPGTSLPARRLLLQAEDLLRELEAKVAELLQRQGGNGCVHAPPDVSH